ncbi:MAG: hypothetical protein ACP5SB_00400 [Caldisericaceae bacterium]
MENTFKSVEKESLQDSQQKLENGNSEEFKAFVKNNIGAHYIAEFNEEMIRKRKELDMKVNEMLEKGRGIIILGNVGISHRPVNNKLCFVTKSDDPHEAEYIAKVLINPMEKKYGFRGLNDAYERKLSASCKKLLKGKFADCYKKEVNVKGGR